MGKRELKALEKEQAERQAKRNAVFRGLWERPAYQRMQARKDTLLRAITDASTSLERAQRCGADLLVWPLAAQLQQAKRRFSRYHRRIIAIEHAALKAAGFPNG